MFCYPATVVQSVFLHFCNQQQNSAVCLEVVCPTILPLSLAVSLPPFPLNLVSSHDCGVNPSLQSIDGKEHSCTVWFSKYQLKRRAHCMTGANWYFHKPTHISKSVKFVLKPKAVTNASVRQKNHLFLFCDGWWCQSGVTCQLLCRIWKSGTDCVIPAQFSFPTLIIATTLELFMVQPSLLVG